MNLRLAIASLTGLLWSTVAAAQGVRLSWSAPERCPTGDEVQRAIERRLGRPIAQVDPPLHVDAQVRAVRGGYELRLRTEREGRETGLRRLKAPTCRELSDATALIVALAIDPRVEETLEAPAAGGDAEAPAAGRDAETRGEPDTSQPPPTTGDTAESERDAAEGAADRQEADQVDERVPVREAEDADVRRAGEEQAAEPEDVEEEEAPELALADTGPPLRVGAYVRAGLAGDVGSLPSLAAGPALGVGVSLDALRIELTGLWLPPNAVDSPRRPRSVGELRLLGAGLGLCYGRPARELAAAPCVRAEYGRVTGRGQNIRDPEGVDAAWALLWGGIELALPLARGLFLNLEAGVGLPLLRTVFTVGDVGRVHEAGDVVGRGAVGLALEL